ncbi:hypothetical protein GYMLUDRAFT_704142 [Collybiopsis luxurians FD-317 M1]|uniref:Uncharacterized protein n=1 Tax=Collybiopsis luxurians FD-317 M1 TaxID=944289 RepID=A0A0D0CIB2_9AGAR|nr:hypothetical protein GYMLUDRAFT_704142 [Collybiopsis luxurians FD-317 M1]
MDVRSRVHGTLNRICGEDSFERWISAQMVWITIQVRIRYYYPQGLIADVETSTIHIFRAVTKMLGMILCCIGMQRYMP